jgi:hypothetical protein
MIIAPMPAAIRRILNDDRTLDQDDSCCGIDEFEIHYPPTDEMDGLLNLFRFRWSESRKLDQTTMPWEYEHQVWAPGALVCQAMIDLALDALGPADSDEVAKAIPPFLAFREATKDCHLLYKTLIPEHKVLVQHDKPFVVIKWAFNDPCMPLRSQPRWFSVAIPEELIVRTFVGCLALALRAELPEGTE